LPGGYTNWGRYAQLTGQAILPVALWLLWESAAPSRALPLAGAPARLSRVRLLRMVQRVGARLRNSPTLRQAFPPGALRLAAVSGFALAGMTLAYYRMPFFYAAFAAVWLLSWVLPRLGSNWLWGGQVLTRLAVVGLAGVGFLLPWLPRLFSSKLAVYAEGGLSGSAVSVVVAELYPWRELFLHVPVSLLGLSVLAALLALLRREWLVGALPLWFALLPLYVASQGLGFPGANMLQSFTIIIALYIPISLLLGWLLAYAQQALQVHLERLDEHPAWQRMLARSPLATSAAQNRPASLPSLGAILSDAVLAALVLALAFPGALAQRLEVQPASFALVTHPDRAAMEWIKANTPPESIFLVEGYSIYNGTSVVGSDAGWWLPVFTGRGNSIPPQYALFSEAPVREGYTQKVIGLAAALEQSLPGEPPAVQAICDLNITHVYIGQRQGQVGFGARQLFTAEAVENSPLFQRIYAQDRVRIYTFNRSGCR
jgi:hypothetical protein